MIFGLVLTIAIGYRVLNFDFDVPLFKTEVTVSFKSEDDQADKKEEEKH